MSGFNDGLEYAASMLNMGLEKRYVCESEKWYEEGILGFAAQEIRKAKLREEDDAISTCIAKDLTGMDRTQRTQTVRS